MLSSPGSIKIEHIALIIESEPVPKNILSGFTPNSSANSLLNQNLQHQDIN
ncbi:hypothetical protein PWK10_02650 [Caloramator sp. Dgby_cultured_2]|nr:hypothetical protein [Caloramator sp. Dgby_cultured_2]WDU83565.1 hypothetical protein PWK10_02650 [Caloramator sp. Dgby_cultured_2]